MRYFTRLLAYLTFFFLSFSICYVVVLKFIPVTITPLKIVKFVDNKFTHDEDETINTDIKSIDSKWVDLDKISKEMIKAVIASEDNGFLDHKGFDWHAIEQAIKYNRENEKTRGASTISQQVAKNVFCLPSRTWFRKAIEAYYTLLIEILWGKERIMEVYLNIVELHPNVYGVETAANRFFQKSAQDLTLYEASLIATVLPSPRTMNLAAPSTYMRSRSRAIRTNVAHLGNIEF